MKIFSRLLAINLPWAGYLLVVSMTGIGMPQVAVASNGQCRWEGGPGFPIHSSCRREDCLGEGGLTMCTEPEFRPPIGSNDSQVDDEKFSYRMCDMAAASIGRIRRWCEVQGGTWTLVGGGEQECRNLPAQYPGIGIASNEGAALAAGAQFASGNSSCPRVLGQDTGWGLSESTSYNCWNGGPVYQNGQLVSDLRKQIWNPISPCTTDEGIKYLKTRRLVCPHEYASRTKPNGELQCFIPIAQCNVHGNPVDCSIGAKLESQVDYRAADGLDFTRFYNSHGRYRPVTGAAFVSVPEDYWRHSYSRRLIFISGNSDLAAVLSMESGYLVAFDPSGAEIFNKDGAARRLEPWGGGWRIIQPDSDIENYDAAGRLTSIVARTGLTTTLAYDAGRLKTISNSFGRTITLNYTAGVLSSLSIPGGGQISYAYDALGRLTSVVNADSTTRTYHYDDAGNGWLLTGITDENGSRFSTYGYNSNGYVASEEHAGGVNQFSFQIGDPKVETSSSVVTDPLGKTRTFTYRNVVGVSRIKQTSGYCPSCSNISDSSFDANGNSAHKTDLNGRRTNYVYDLARNLEISRTEGLTNSGATTASTRTITTEWHATFRLPTVTRTYAGAVSTGIPLQVISVEYDTSGNAISRTVHDPATDTSRTWTYSYDEFGRVLSANGPRTDVNDVTVYAYHQCSNGGECGQLHTVTNAAGHVTTYAAYDAHGQPTLMTDANGVQTELEYDARQRLVRSTAAFGTSAAESTIFEYWPTGQIKRVTHPDGSYLTYAYDAAHRLVRVEDNAGNKQEYVLDAAGNRQSTNAYDPYGTLVSVQRRLYNTVGQLWQILSAAGTDVEATVLGYDQNGNETSSIAPLGRVTTKSYDEVNRLKQVIDPAGGVVSFGYNALDALIQVTDPRGLVTEYQYDGFGDLRQLSSPDTGVTSSTYDASGNVVTSTNARGATTTSTYDAMNRVLTNAFSLNGATDQTIVFSYDSGINGKGRLTGAADANHSMNWNYDALGRVTNKTQSVGGMAKMAAYAYSNGHLTSMLTPSGQSIGYSYDSNGRVSGISVNGIPLISDIVHDAFGPIRGWTWSNGMLTVRNFDLDGRVDLIDSAGLSTYTYYADGRIASRFDDSAISYSLASGSTALMTSTGSNRVNSTTGFLERTYSYDPAGNTLGDGTSTFTYNFANRMSSATRGGVTANYTYNALGQRVRKMIGSTTRFFFYDEGGHLLGQYDGAGALVEEIVWLGDIPIATLRPAGAVGIEVFYVHVDHLNTPRRITRPLDNEIVWRWDSDPYGVAEADDDPDGDNQTFAFNLRFPGQYWDSESNLHYNYYRDYDPAVGRYVESDPIGLKGGLNTFAYGLNSPVNYVDPKGLVVQRCCRPAALARGKVDHCWLKTDTKSAGMNSTPSCRIAGNNYEFLWITKVYVSDHSCDTATTCETLHDIDEQCVNRELEVGKPLGRFGFTNNCQMYAADVIRKCRKRSALPPLSPLLDYQGY
jgi:RHS repeat-associated protein